MEQFCFSEIRSASIHSLTISLCICVKPASLTPSEWRDLQERAQALRIVSERLARPVGISSLGLEPSPAKKKIIKLSFCSREMSTASNGLQFRPACTTGAECSRGFLDSSSPHQVWIFQTIRIHFVLIIESFYTTCCQRCIFADCCASDYSF